MISIHNLSMIYGSKVLFADVDLLLTDSERYALVGANGTGKSTLLRLIAGQEEPTDGTITLPKNVNLGWLKQDQYRYEHDIVLNVVLMGKAQLWQALQEKFTLLKKGDLSEKEGYRLSELEEEIALHDGYSAESLAEELLTGLGIRPEQQYEEMSRLSGGFKLRVLLAQALFNNPDILILDEPNNYLDIITIAWLEDYLKNQYHGLLIFTSHDQDFLNNLATHVLDVDYGEIKSYPGNYSNFLKQKVGIMEQKLKEQAYLEKKKAKLQAFVDRFKASAARSKQATSRQKAIDKMEMPDIQRSSRISPTFSFIPLRASGKEVLKVSNICKTFEDRAILKNVSFTIMRDEKVAIIGQNGIGKSTLLKIITNTLPADSGTFSWGFETHISYFAQEHNEMKRDERFAIDWLSANTTNVTSSALRATLGGALFSQSDVFKKVSVLSGGEITRLLFAKMSLDKANVLILDEPTNHLDIESRQELANALTKFQGTVILVSHDRHFVMQIATRIIALTQKGIIDFKGTYAEYAQQHIDHLSKSNKK